MTRQIVWTVALILLSLGFGLLLIRPIQVTSQSPESQPQLNNVIQDVLKAEEAGAQPGEMQGLANELNSLLVLEDQLQTLGPQDAGKRAQLVSEIGSNLASLDAQASQVAVAASRRTMLEHIILYSFSGIAAIVATIAFHYTLLLMRKSRGKRALQSKIVRK